MLGSGLADPVDKGDRLRGHQYKQFIHRYTDLLGALDGSGLLVASRHARRMHSQSLDATWIVQRRERLLKWARIPLISDQVRLAPSDPKQTADISFRILPALRTPDAILFQRTTDPRDFQRSFPTGIEVAALLGSPFARDRLPAQDKAKLLAVIEKSRPLLKGTSLYLQYLDCIAALLGAPEPDAPAFMKGEPWQAKSCQAALAGWAQLRHTWALQAKQSVVYSGLTDDPAGFVEPVPEFFARMAALIERTEELLEQSGAFEQDLREIGRRVGRVLDAIERSDAATEGNGALRTLPKAVMPGLMDAIYLARAMGSAATEGHESEAALLIRRMPELKALAAALERGVAPVDERVRAVVRFRCTQIEPLWSRLGTLCRRLEALAHKQLRGVPLSKEENRFIKGYGIALGGIMLYGGNSWLSPKDDAPRVADVFFNPNVRSKYLEVGIARPRTLWVLYPWQGRDVLCRGAVLPYYEFTSPQRLTNAEWKAILGSEKRPAPPAWLGPLLGREGIGKPQFPKRH